MNLAKLRSMNQEEWFVEQCHLRMRRRKEMQVATDSARVKRVGVVFWVPLYQGDLVDHGFEVRLGDRNEVLA